MEESVVYQDILRKGEQRGEKKLAMLLLERRFRKLAPEIRTQVEHLPVERIEELCVALLDFKTADELRAWLKKMEESVVYQDILQKGEQRGERKVALLQLEERFGKLSPKIRKQIERLPAKQLEGLIKALLYFKGSDELIAWLKRNNA